MQNGFSQREVPSSVIDSGRDSPFPSQLPFSAAQVPLIDNTVNGDDWDNDDNDDNDAGGCSSNSSFVDLDQIAVQMNVRVEDLLRALQNGLGGGGGGGYTAPENRLRSQFSSAGSTSLNRGDDSNNGTRNNCSGIDFFSYVDHDNESNHADNRSGGNESDMFGVLRQHLSKEALSKTQLLSFAVEDSNLSSQEREQQIREGTGTETVTAPIVFLSTSSTRGSGLHLSPIPSTEPLMRANAPSPLPSPSPQPPRRIRFGSRVVTSVCVYSVNNEVYFGLQFRQHWSSWAALLCGFLLETVFEVHLDWFAKVGSATTHDTIPIAHWVYTYRSLFSVVYGLLWLLCGAWRDGVRSLVAVTAEPLGVCMKSLAVTLVSSFFFSLAAASMVLTNEMSGSSLLFTTTVMHCLWILFYRVSRAQMVFLVEVCGSIMLIVGNVLCNVDGMRLMGLRDTIYGNLLMSGGSLLFATAFLVMAYGLQRGLCSTTGLTVAVGIELFFTTFIMGVCYGYSMSSGVGDSLIAGFQHANAMHSCLLAAEDLFFNVMYLYALYHLDVLSVSACFSLKVAVVPIVEHFLVWRVAEKVPPVVRARWGPLLFVGVGVVAVAAAFVMFFASVRRRFVARRLFHMRGLRRVPDPYQKKKRGRHERRQRLVAASSSW
ncbi:hypothetical protein Tc00.1047053506227.200 [Trypanosoma cruzi]|uniref:Transmembrane protein n=1 Tax=Trypanosoma cruzi (strain CL Brener) TaxID=353153 RepID=Q4DSV0_TRYCC|nr:hypothetical protein Tc00.1047053506227.200 [Trypanosoma cruzi]EAN95613.1 hypothetical protein Tc00.1047053506227.200 [Trypanosoma cruzi]|eukprot:XP_817464.1 hypothetical protein [Trypanosoma cruzi strain CL Brener]